MQKRRRGLLGTVEKRGKNSWRLSAMVKLCGKWQSVHLTLRMDPNLSEAVQRRDAERELAIFEKRLAAEILDDFTLAAWSEEWITKYLPSDASPVTVSNYRFLLQSRILPQLGDRYLQDLTPAILTDWLYGLRSAPRKSTRKPEEQLARPRRKSEKLVPAKKAEKALSTKTLQNYYGCMKTMLAAAVRIGILEHNPMDRVLRPKARKKKISTLSESETLFLIRALENESQPLRLSVLLALACGLRLGETCALRYFDIDWEKKTITVDKAVKYTPATGSFTAAPKTSAGDRVLSLPDSLLLILRAAMWDDVDAEVTDPKWQGNNQRWIIHGRHGSQVNKDTPSKWFRTFADAHGFNNITFHDLRHAHASLLVAKGVDIAAVSARLGHADPSVTLSVYTHALPNRDQAAAAAMDQILAKVRPADSPQDPETETPPALPAGS